MLLNIEIEKCDKCGTCIAVCPNNALTLAECLKVDDSKCIRCGTCITICPFAALSMEM